MRVWVWGERSQHSSEMEEGCSSGDEEMEEQEEKELPHCSSQAEDDCCIGGFATHDLLPWSAPLLQPPIQSALFSSPGLAQGRRPVASPSPIQPGLIPQGDKAEGEKGSSTPSASASASHLLRAPQRGA